MQTVQTGSTFRSVPKTGVIYVMDQATKKGYYAQNENWANLGQGSPEVGDIEGAPSRVQSINIDQENHHYSPVPGMKELRQKVADYYNVYYRKGKDSQYTYENVSICAGGRLALTRVCAVLGDINLGHFIPDYTAYEELLGLYKAFTPVPLFLDPLSQYQLEASELKEEIYKRGIGALLLSNPCNPTGRLISNGLLKDWIEVSRDLNCSFIFDEFYSHYIYPESQNDRGTMVSAAEYVEDVNSDPVIIIDGLTKNWRYPGWRVSWTLGPKDVIESIASAGSFIDGGATHPFQKQAIDLLDPEISRQETRAIQKLFMHKRDYVVDRLQKMGVIVEHKPDATFYVWANLSQLPEPLNDCLSFFERGLDFNVITVPGVFFDINPGQKRPHSKYNSYCRISFGPEMSILKRGLDALEKMISHAHCK